MHGQLLKTAALIALACHTFGTLGTHEHALRAQNAAPVPAIQFGEETVMVCANCNREVPASAQNGQRCPFCGVLWDASGAIPILPPVTPAADTPTEDQPMHADPAPAVQPAAQHAAPVAQPVAAPLPPAANFGMPEKLDAANLPIWMKVTLFVGSLAALWYFFLFRR